MLTGYRVHLSMSDFRHQLGNKMFTYIAMYKGKQIEVKAATSYAAQLEAATQFKAKKSYEVDVYLVAKPNGETVTQVMTN